MQNNFVEQKLSSDDVFLEEELFTVFDVNSLYKSEISVPLKIENQECSLQLDTVVHCPWPPKPSMSNFVPISL